MKTNLCKICIYPRFLVLLHYFRRYYKKMCLPRKKASFKVSKEYVLELLKLTDKKHLHDELIDWVLPKFPLTGDTLRDNNYTDGKKVQYILLQMREVWADSNFTLEVDDLMKYVPQCAQNFDDERNQKKDRNLKNDYPTNSK